MFDTLTVLGEAVLRIQAARSM